MWKWDTVSEISLIGSALAIFTCEPFWWKASLLNYIVPSQDMNFVAVMPVGGFVVFVAATFTFIVPPTVETSTLWFLSLFFLLFGCFDIFSPAVSGVLTKPKSTLFKTLIRQHRWWLFLGYEACIDSEFLPNAHAVLVFDSSSLAHFGLSSPCVIKPQSIDQSINRYKLSRVPAEQWRSPWVQTRDQSSCPNNGGLGYTCLNNYYSKWQV